MPHAGVLLCVVETCKFSACQCCALLPACGRLPVTGCCSVASHGVHFRRHLHCLRREDGCCGFFTVSMNPCFVLLWCAADDRGVRAAAAGAEILLQPVRFSPFACLPRPPSSFLLCLWRGCVICCFRGGSTDVFRSSDPFFHAASCSDPLH